MVLCTIYPSLTSTLDGHLFADSRRSLKSRPQLLSHSSRRPRLLRQPLLLPSIGTITSPSHVALCRVYGLFRLRCSTRQILPPPDPRPLAKRRGRRENRVGRSVMPAWPNVPRARRCWTAVPRWTFTAGCWILIRGDMKRKIRSKG